MTTDAPCVPVPVPQRAPTPPAPLRLLERDTPSAYLADAGRVLADAFKTDQISRLISGSVPGLDVARMTRTVVTGTLDLEAYVVEDETGAGKILGVMVVKPPGFEHRSRCVSFIGSRLGEKGDEQPLDSVLGQSAALSRARERCPLPWLYASYACTQAYPSPNSEGPHAAAAEALAAQAPNLEGSYSKLKKAIHDLETEAFGPRQVSDIYYISHIGVAPGAQGHGIGKAFCAYMAARGKKEGIPVSLLTMSAGHASIGGRRERENEG